MTTNCKILLGLRKYLSKLNQEQVLKSLSTDYNFD